MASRARINPLSVMFVVGILAYGVYTVNRHGARQVPGRESDSLARHEADSLPNSQPHDVDTDANHEEVQAGQVLSGRVVKIVDGDTIDLLLNNRDIVRIRLDGIDAPERGQAFGHEARQYLGRLCHEQAVFAMILNRDRYNRLIADVYQQSTWVNGEMVKAGMAWHYKRYNNSRDLAALEQSAQQSRLGIWVDGNAVAPWQYRAERADGQRSRKTHPVGLPADSPTADPDSAQEGTFQRDVSPIRRPA